jgi:hypothetical protein
VVTLKAILYAFPHHRDKLDEYPEWIQGHFATTQTNLAFHVIELDKAIRRFAGERRNVELTEFGKFAKLEKAFLQSGGIFFTDQLSRSKNDVIKSDEICRLYNAGICCRRGSTCKYKHVCKSCRAKHLNCKQVADEKKGSGTAGAKE